MKQNRLISQLYTDRLRELGVDVTERINSTDEKNLILQNDDIGHALPDASLDDGDDEAICLAKANAGYACTF